MSTTWNQRQRLITFATVSGVLVDLRTARRQQIVTQALGKVWLAGRKSALRCCAVVQLFPVVRNVVVGGVARYVIVEEDEEEAMSL